MRPLSDLETLRRTVRTGDTPPAEIASLRAPQLALLSHVAGRGLAERRPDLSAAQRLSRPQGVLLSGLLLAAILGGLLAPIALGVVITSLFLLHSFAGIALRLGILGLRLSEKERPAPPPLPDDALPIVTILVPLYRETDGLRHLHQALLAIDYPRDRLDIKFVLEGDDFDTIAAGRALCTEDVFDLCVVPPGEPRTKPKALNFALWSAKGDLLVIYDAEDRPEPDQLRKAAAAFAAGPEELVCLQARLNYYNREKTWIAALFAAEYALLFDFLLPGLARLGAPLPLGGTSNIFKTDTLIELGGWDPHNVTEDADLGLRLARAGLRAETLDSTTYEEATAKPGPWLRQRSRWIKGFIQTFLVHARRGPKDARFAITHYLVIGGVLVAALLNPVYWGICGLWLTGYAAWADHLFPGPLGPLATLALLLGNGVHLWLFFLAPVRRGWFDLVPALLLTPLYWALQSVAGYKALAGFLVNPFYWEKTQHGQGLPPGEAMALVKTAP